MTAHSRPTWPPQSPAPDFADRTVSAILRDQHRRQQKRHIRRWVPLAAAATLLVAGGAWAVTSLPFVSPRAWQEEPAAPGHAFSEEIELPLPPGRAPEPTPSAPTPPAVAPARRKISPAATPDAGRPLILPRCNCQEAICDCLEQH